MILRLAPGMDHSLVAVDLLVYEYLEERINSRKSNPPDRGGGAGGGVRARGAELGITAFLNRLIKSSVLNTGPVKRSNEHIESKAAGAYHRTHWVAVSGQ